jgi:hypothetical protein
MKNPPLIVHPSIKLEDNEYVSSDLRDAAQYVNSFHVYCTLTTNINIEMKHALATDIFSPLIQSAKELTAFVDDNSDVNAEDFKARWSFHKDRLKAKDPIICKDDFMNLWFNAKVALVMNKDDFTSSDFFSRCNDPSVLMNPRTGYGKAMWNYARYRADKHDLIAVLVDYHNVSDQSNAALSRPSISIVAKGDNLNYLLSDAFKYCKITNYYPVKHGKLFYLRIGRIKLNESHFRKQGKDLLEGYDEVITKKLRKALRENGLLLNMYPWPGCIQFNYRPETWDEYVSVIKKELRELNAPESTIIVSNSHPYSTTECKVYDD